MLASDEVNKDVLVVLLSKAHEALDEAQCTVETETANALDLANPDPDASDELVRKANRTSTRLTIAIPKLRDRIKSIELFEYNQSWHEQADVVEARADKAAERLGHYAKFITWLQAEFAEIDEINAEIDALHLRAPSGEDRRLIEPELVARGLANFDAAHPRLRDNLKLPDFIRASVIAFPPSPMDEFNRHAAQINEAMAQRMKDKFGLTHSPNWAAGREMQIARDEQEFAARDAELKEKATADKVEYEARLQAAERKRLGVLND